MTSFGEYLPDWSLTSLTLDQVQEHKELGSLKDMSELNQCE